MCDVCGQHLPLLLRGCDVSLHKLLYSKKDKPKKGEALRNALLSVGIIPGPGKRG